MSADVWALRRTGLKVDVGCPSGKEKSGGFQKTLLIIPKALQPHELTVSFSFSQTSTVFSLLCSLEPSNGYISV